MKYYAGHYDVAVIGAGHAGIEAGLAAARLGCKTCVFTISADWVGNMPCNPAIGGTSKGHLVREIDALGGEMAVAADRNLIQSRMLNLGKGPAVHSPRAQIDRRDYSAYMKRVLEETDGLDLRQGEIVDLSQMDETKLSALRDLPSTETLPEHCPLWQLTTQLEAIYTAETVILATGTFLGGRVYVGDVSYASGPDGLFPATELSGALQRLGIPTRRFKTGTPSRVNARSVDLDKLEVQYGDEQLVRFSDDPSISPENKAVCYITYTGEETKKIILANLERSPLYGGKIEGIGPRYCPSIEDKIVRFPEKERHQIFIEPCGLHTEELYLQGLSSSLPEDVQLKFLRTISGLEHVQVIRTA
ncbi:MAG: tRNA uridine-5-carboxymethylaminomethyl(34) synthesis enzyme MnmG, partial [Clostridia bacterium]|nr:tRNA uridine-5-carboxymethylaminomethyl(34) synthesis enzyme MnmG [Clostridia bacterium]